MYQVLDFRGYQLGASPCSPMQGRRGTPMYGIQCKLSIGVELAARGVNPCVDTPMDTPLP